MKPASLGAAASVLACCLLLTHSATATNNVNFSHGSTLTGTTAGVSLSEFRLVSIVGIHGRDLIFGDRGSVSFPTPSPASSRALPNGALFSSTFSGPVSWTLITLGGGTHNYTVTGVVVGTIVGQLVNAVTVQLTIAGTGFSQDSPLIVARDTRTVSSVPEPSTLALLFTGGVGTLGMMWRKLLAR